METLNLGSDNNICLGFLLELDLCIKIAPKTILGLIWKTSNTSKVLDKSQHILVCLRLLLDTI